jgi:hypothetical protein
MSRPKGSKNKPKTTDVTTSPITEKRPRGRPRKSTIGQPVVAIKVVAQPRVLPNNLCEDNDGEYTRTLDLPELEEDTHGYINSFESTRWTSDDWGGGYDSFSIGTDSNY